MLVAFFTNPGQAAHLNAIKQTIALRKPGAASDTTTAVMPLVRYNNYFVFSTVSFGYRTLAYGFLGQMLTTDEIGWIVRGLNDQRLDSD